MTSTSVRISAGDGTVMFGRRRNEPLLDHVNNRKLPPDYAGDILLWDIDKTYLDTRFSSVRGLAAIPFEFAIDKQSLPGSVTLLRALRRGPSSRSAIVPLYFVSGSPPQLRRTIERRMTMDGVDFDGITFKDQLGLVMRGRLRSLREQVGYKLTALLWYRRAIPAAGRWLMFGDDVEADADVFLLFGEVCAGLRGAELEGRLESLGVDPRDIDNIQEAVADIEIGDDPILRVFVHLARHTDPSAFSDPRVIPTHSYLQSALVLYGLGRVNAATVGAVARDLRLRGVPEHEIDAHLNDARDRLEVPTADLALAAVV